MVDANNVDLRIAAIASIVDDAAEFSITGADAQNANFSGLPDAVIIPKTGNRSCSAATAARSPEQFAVRILDALDAAGADVELRFRYRYANTLDAGKVTVTFLPGAWVDPLGNPGAAGTQQFAVITQAKSFFISLSGGVILSAFGLAELFSLRAEVLILIDTERHVFSLDFNGQLKVIGLGTIGSTAGRFVLDTNQGVKLWGVMTVETDFSTLEPYGIFLFGKGTIAVNTTNEAKCETLTLPGLATPQTTTIPCVAPPTPFGAGTGATRTFLIEPQSFLIEIVGQARIRPPNTTTDLVRLSGGFVLSINPNEFILFATASISFGIGDAQLTYASATGLLIARTGNDGRAPGIAGYLKVSQSAGIGLPEVGSLFHVSGTITVMFNTTREDQVFEMPGVVRAAGRAR